jgi:quercetin dioxygenase-like cupin family protein
MANPIEQALNGVILPYKADSRVSEPEPGLRREILAHSPAMMLVRHVMKKGWEGVAHSHPHEQMVYVISGCIRVTVDGTSMDASAGDSFIVASNVRHQAFALEDSVVLDIFTPAREDYL